AAAVGEEVRGIDGLASGDVVAQAVVVADLVRHGEVGGAAATAGGAERAVSHVFLDDAHAGLEAADLRQVGVAASVGRVPPRRDEGGDEVGAIGVAQGGRLRSTRGVVPGAAGEPGDHVLEAVHRRTVPFHRLDERHHAEQTVAGVDV